MVPSVFTHFPVLKINGQILKNFNPKTIIKSANAKQLIQCMWNIVHTKPLNRLNYKIKLKKKKKSTRQSSVDDWNVFTGTHSARFQLLISNIWAALHNFQFRIILLCLCLDHPLSETSCFSSHLFKPLLPQSPLSSDWPASRGLLRGSTELLSCTDCSGSGSPEEICGVTTSAHQQNRKQTETFKVGDVYAALRNQSCSSLIHEQNKTYL